MMTHQQLQEILRNELGVRKELVALKVWQGEPTTIKRYEGKAFPGMCTQIGEVLACGETFYTTQEQCFCTGGVIATGVAPPLSEKKRKEMIEVHFEISRGYRDVKTALLYEQELDKFRQPLSEKNVAVQLGLLEDIVSPNLVFIFCKPGAADIVNRAYTYEVGEPIQGFGGNGGCVFLIQYPYTTKKPVFSYSDVAWRKYIGLPEEELTLSFPYQSLLTFIEVLSSVAKEYRNYGEVKE